VLRYVHGAINNALRERYINVRHNNDVVIDVKNFLASVIAVFMAKKEEMYTKTARISRYRTHYYYCDRLLLEYMQLSK